MIRPRPQLSRFSILVLPWLFILFFYFLFLIGMLSHSFLLHPWKSDFTPPCLPPVTLRSLETMDTMKTCIRLLAYYILETWRRLDVASINLISCFRGGEPEPYGYYEKGNVYLGRPTTFKGLGYWAWMMNIDLRGGLEGYERRDSDFEVWAIMTYSIFEKSSPCVRFLFL
jgi:hypothetical protein